MEFKPHEYQLMSLKHLEQNTSAGLFLDCGLGKTVVTLTFLKELLYDYFVTGKILVIAPLRVAEDTWSREIEKWDHLNTLTISKVLGPPKRREDALTNQADIYIINRENVEWIVDYYKKTWPFKTIVIDELSSFKSSKSKRFRALKKILPFTSRVIGLTGTPAPRNLLDLWAEIYLLDQGARLGRTNTKFKESFFNPGKRNGHIVYEWIPKEQAEEDIYNRIGDICMSLTADDWLNVPERIDLIHEIELTPKARKLYNQLEKEKIAEINKSTIVGGNAAVVVGKLLQIANGAIYVHSSEQTQESIYGEAESPDVEVVHDEKLKCLEQLIEEANGQPVMVFYNYKHDYEEIDMWCGKTYNIRTIESSQDIQDWNDGKIEVLLVHPDSMGHGLNLQDGGNIIIWFGLTWNLESYMQANARLHRQGQKKAVLVHHIIAKDTVDEDVMNSLKNKAITQNDLIQAVKARLERYEK
ncbi:DEAD/DEAH box helicase [Anaerorhabdus sp.]|uniref:DEAD/DEAH box helicase n=2 Tax=Anaerorhabdus sp. TaxID=1872524 RepID=UPI002FCBF165